MKLYVNELYFGYSKYLILGSEYLELLTLPNREGCLPLHKLLESGMPEMITIYLAQLDSMVALRIIGNDYIKNIILSSTQRGQSVLQLAITSGSIGAIKTLVYFIENNFSRNDRYEIMQKLLQGELLYEILRSDLLERRDVLEITNYIDGLRQYYLPTEIKRRKNEETRQFYGSPYPQEVNNTNYPAEGNQSRYDRAEPPRFDYTNRNLLFYPSALPPLPTYPDTRKRGWDERDDRYYSP